MKAVSGALCPLAAVACSLLLQTACSSPPTCQTIESAAVTLTTRGAPCAADAGANPFVFSINNATCSAELTECSSSDVSVLDNFGSCANSVPTCTPETQQAFESAVLNCLGPLASLSDACSMAILGSVDGGF